MLLETVALRPDQSPQSSQARYPPRSEYSPETKSKRSLAVHSYAGNSDRHDHQWLKEQGLLSVKELWVNIHYSRPNGGISSVNRPVRTRTRVEDPVLAGVVWGLGGQPPRLSDSTDLEVFKEDIYPILYFGIIDDTHPDDLR